MSSPATGKQTCGLPVAVRPALFTSREAEAAGLGATRYITAPSCQGTNSFWP